MEDYDGPEQVILEPTIARNIAAAVVFPNKVGNPWMASGAPERYLVAVATRVSAAVHNETASGTTRYCPGRRSVGPRDEISDLYPVRQVRFDPRLE